MDCNGVLAQYGYEVRIDHRSNLDRGLEAPKEKHRGVAPAEELEQPVQEITEDPCINQEAEPVETTPAVDDPLETSEPLSTVESVEPEPIEVPTVDQETTEPPMAEDLPEEPIHERVKTAVEVKRNIDWLATTRNEIDALEIALRQAEKEAEIATMAFAVASQVSTAAQAERAVAVQHAKSWSKDDGSPLGLHVHFRVPLVGWEVDYKTPTRRVSERALLAKERAEMIEAAAHKKSEEAAKIAVEKNMERKLLKVRLDAQREKIKSMLDEKHAIYGEARQIDETVAALEANMKEIVQGISSTDISAAYQEGDLEPEEAAEACRIVGDEESAQGIERETQNMRNRYGHSVH
jgi:hypothetical protein